MGILKSSVCRDGEASSAIVFIASKSKEIFYLPDHLTAIVDSGKV
jgi:hypothetical protein